MGRTLCNLEIYVFFRVDSMLFYFSVEFRYDWSKPREKLPLNLTWGYCFILLKGVQDLTVCKIKYYIFICFYFQFVSNEACQSTTFFLLFDFRLCQTKLFNQDIILNEHVKLSFLSIGCNSMINVLWIYFEIFGRSSIQIDLLQKRHKIKWFLWRNINHSLQLSNMWKKYGLLKFSWVINWFWLNNGCRRDIVVFESEFSLWSSL